MRKLLSVALGLGMGGAVLAASGPHPIEFWREIARHDFALPAGAAAPELAGELVDFVGSPDPERRDELGYTITAEWVRRGVLAPEDVGALVPRWRAHLNAAGPDKVLDRAFGALHLALAAEADLRRPFLTEAEFRGLLDDALALLPAEADLRGWDAQVGWVHVTAHTADLLKGLVRNSRLQPADQARVLDAVARRLETAPMVFTHGEAERLAAVAVALAGRADLDRAGFLAAMKRLADLPEGFSGIAPVPAAYAARRNAVAFLEAVYLGLGVQGLKHPAARETAEALLATVTG
ncbi:MAG TPA: DUF2785 domain-containing protein [Opitutaceae bacterium]|nr:DUF2785 domain-containing protein [Opitutaceae bacterium]